VYETFLDSIQPTVVFASYWRYAVERQQIYLKRLKGERQPWTVDPVLRDHRFTNVFRASDRVSQFCIKDVIYQPGTNRNGAEEVVFRILLFKLFNSIPAWMALQMGLRESPSWKSFDAVRYGEILGKAKDQGIKIWNPAYMQRPQTGSDLVGKHNNYLNLLERMVRSGITEKLQSADTYEQAYNVLRAFSPAIGDFTAMQLVTDINYSTVINFDEDDFIVPGPGCLRGIQKCFDLPSVSVPEAQELINHIVAEQDGFFQHYGHKPVTLFGRRLHAIDVQNLFCETDKYARAAHPEFKLKDGERIKQTFKEAGPFPPTFFPPKWNLVVSI
jgi:alpha-glutamyl/putrescinyl thymine pyrophosphorylase clade 1